MTSDGARWTVSLGPLSPIIPGMLLSNDRRNASGRDSPAVVFRTGAASAPSDGGATVASHAPMVDDGTGTVYECANDGQWAPVAVLSAPGADIDIV